MKVTLISHTPSPEKVVSAAAKLCYSKSPADEIMDNLTDENVEKFLSRLVEIGHQSPLEHAVFTFGIDGISRACSHQLVRHRMASYSQKSQRYVEEDKFHYVIPQSIVELDDYHGTLNYYAYFMEYCRDTYEEIKEKLKDMYIKKGVCEKQAEKKAMEDARYVLPNACRTNIVVTMNARELIHFFKQRCCNRAQWEIREVADEMLRICKEIAPILFKNAGAPCVCGNCPEGSMSCGEPRK